MPEKIYWEEKNVLFSIVLLVFDSVQWGAGIKVYSGLKSLAYIYLRWRSFAEKSYVFIHVCQAVVLWGENRTTVPLESRILCDAH